MGNSKYKIAKKTLDKTFESIKTSEKELEISPFTVLSIIQTKKKFFVTESDITQEDLGEKQSSLIDILLNLSECLTINQIFCLLYFIENPDNSMHQSEEDEFIPIGEENKESQTKIQNSTSLVDISTPGNVARNMEDSFQEEVWVNYSEEETLRTYSLYESLADLSSDQTVNKIRLAKENMKILQRLTDHKNLEVRGFYGFHNQIKRSSEQFMRNRIDLVQPNPNPVLCFVFKESKVAFLLSVSDELFRQKFDPSHLIIDLLRILQDLTTRIELCISTDFNPDWEAKNVFQTQHQYRQILEKNKISNESKVEIQSIGNDLSVNLPKSVSPCEQSFHYLETQLSLNSNCFYERKTIQVPKSTSMFNSYFYIYQYMYLDFEKVLNDRPNVLLQGFPEKDKIKKVLEMCKLYIRPSKSKEFEEYRSKFLKNIEKNQKKVSLPHQITEILNHLKENHFIEYRQDYEVEISLKFHQLMFSRKDSQQTIQEFDLKEINQGKTLLKKMILKDKEVRVAGVWSLGENIGLILIQKSDQEILYRYTISQNNIEVSFRNCYSVLGLQISCDLKNKELFMWNNTKKAVELWRFDNFLNLYPECTLHLFTKNSDSIVDDIADIIQMKEHALIFYLTKEGEFYQYDGKSREKRRINLSSVEEKEGNGKPKDKEVKYERFVKVNSSSVIVLQSRNRIDFLNLNMEVIHQLSQPDIDFSHIVKNEEKEFLVIHSNDKISCFFFEGNNKDSNLVFEKNRKEKVQNEGIPLLDYFYKSNDKFGNYVPYLGHVQTSLYIDKQFYQKCKKYVGEYRTKNLFALSSKKESIYVENIQEFLDIVYSRIPQHVATVEAHKLIPLSDEENMFQNINLSLHSSDQIYQQIDKIKSFINFGVYEKLIESVGNREPIVVSIMGVQSTGKSFLLNKLFGTRFNVDVGRCTDGLWIGISFMKTKERNFCFVLIDCEGLFNTKRSMDEEVKLVLATTAISDISIYNTTNNSDDRHFQQFFEKLHSVSSKLTGSNLFKGWLMMMIRDVKDDQTEIQRLFAKLKEDLSKMILKNQDIEGKIFKKFCFEALVNYQEKEHFQQSIDNLRSDFFTDLFLKEQDKMSVRRWQSGGELIEIFKLVLSHILIDDKQDMDEARFKIKLDLIFEESLTWFRDLREITEVAELKVKAEINGFKGIFYQKDLILLNTNGIEEAQGNSFTKVSKKHNFSKSIQNQSGFVKPCENDPKQEFVSFEENEAQSVKPEEEKAQSVKYEEEEAQSVKPEEEEVYSVKPFANLVISQRIKSQTKEQEEMSSKYVNQPLGIELTKAFFSSQIPYHVKSHNQWMESYASFCQKFFNERIDFVLGKFEGRFEASQEYYYLITSKKDQLRSFLLKDIMQYQYCENLCKKCKRKCTFSQEHEGDCDCSTNHKCLFQCDFKECLKNGKMCSENFGHEEGVVNDIKHFCESPEHFCGKKCDQEKCNQVCKNKINHADTPRHDCEQIHYCLSACKVKSCSNTCITERHTPHIDHICGQKHCSLNCKFYEQCRKKCLFGRHDHQNLIENWQTDLLQKQVNEKELVCFSDHLCDQNHKCVKKCEHSGVCEVTYNTEKQVKDTGMGQKIEYVLYKQERRFNECGSTLDVYKFDHEIHVCQKKVHQCPSRCPECEAFCHLGYNHDGPHQTPNHRNKEKSIYLCDSNIVIEYMKDDKIFKFKAGDNLSHEICSTSCFEKGRGHFHMIECPGGKECFSLINPDCAVHCDSKFIPDQNKKYDLLLCHFYFDHFNWQSPPDSLDKRKENMLCSFKCKHPTHGDQVNLCTKKALHKDDHKFTCVHNDSFSEIQVSFLMDVTGSMSGYIKSSVQTIERIIKEIEQKFKGKLSLQFSFVGYHDHPSKVPDPIDYPIKQIDFTQTDKCISFIRTIEAGGGDDTAEAVVDGFHAAINLSWTQKSRKYIFHIADAPPHGSEFGLSSGDDYPSGCPCRKTFDPLIQKMNSLQITYSFCKIGSLLNIFESIMSKKINSFKKMNLDSPVEMEEKIQAYLVEDLLNRQYDVKLKDDKLIQVIMEIIFLV